MDFIKFWPIFKIVREVEATFTFRILVNLTTRVPPGGRFVYIRQKLIFTGFLQNHFMKFYETWYT